jgi:hypothetical protein
VYISILLNYYFHLIQAFFRPTNKGGYERIGRSIDPFSTKSHAAMPTGPGITIGKGDKPKEDGGPGASSAGDDWACLPCCALHRTAGREGDATRDNK